MPVINPIGEIQSELQKGMKLAKCKRCGCMKQTLENLQASLSLLQTEDSLYLLRNIEHWLEQIESMEYTCLGCEKCISAMAENIFHQAFPEVAETQLSYTFEVKEHWPTVPGEYFSFCHGSGCPVSVSTLASAELAEELAGIRPEELCIVGKTETENTGIDKLIKNIITNSTIRFLILAGEEPEGHYSGNTLLALGENGVDDNMRVIGSHGKYPILKNVTKKEVEAFRKQIKIVNMIGCKDAKTVVKKLEELSEEFDSSCSIEECTEKIMNVQISNVPVVQAKQPAKLELDKKGYFVIIVPDRKSGIIIVEHYSYDNKLQHIIEGKDSAGIYRTIIKNGWVTQLSHAAYLGKELARAELSLKLGFRYVQDDY